MQCKGRYCREKTELKFPVKSGYFTERRCQNIAVGKGCDPELCDTCQDKSRQPWSPKCQQSKFQGKIDQPYFPDSWLFGSERFKKFHELPGNSLYPDVYEYAETAQRLARQGISTEEMPPKSTPKPATVIPQSTPTSVPPPAETKKPGRSKKVAPQPVAAPTESVPVPSVEPFVQKKKTTKKATVAPSPLSAPHAPEPKVYESQEEALEAVEVIKIPLQQKTIHDVVHWYEPTKQKVYERKKDGSIGVYQGRYNRAEDKIQSFPDSDKE
jgi:hypothetical protein